MVNNVFKENELYEPMRQWLQIYLEDKYKLQFLLHYLKKVQIGE